MDKVYRVMITKQAWNHLNAIAQYVYRVSGSRETALRFMNQLRQQIMALSRDPLRFPAEEKEPWQSQGVRRMTYKGFYIYYWINEDTVHVTAVIAVKMDQTRQLRKLDMVQK